MSDNTFGRLLRLTTFGESHGPAIGCVIDGFPPGLSITADEIETALVRRATGRTRHTSQRRESDQVEILSGVFEGTTTGTPIGLLIRNTDARSKDYSDIADKLRPGHADYTYWKKYGIRDYRGGGRSSARETTLRVAAATLVRKWLARQFGIEIQGYLAQVGDLVLDDEGVDWDSIDDTPLFCPNPDRIEALEAHLDALRKSGDSAGSRVTVVARNVPAGLGEPVYGKLDAEIASAMMSINAVKAVEIGAGFESVVQPGTVHRDAITPEGFESNHAGGVLGGISSGQDLRVSMAYKPTSSLRLPVNSINEAGEPVEIKVTGRHDPCVGVRATPIAEAMLAWVIMDQALRHRAQCGWGEET